MRPTWDDLQLCQVDLHIHAGTERPEPYAAVDFIRYAVATGRRIIGATDHFGRFLGRSKKKLNHYPGTLEGYRAFARDIAKAKEAFPDEIILFGPEIGLGSLSCPEEAAEAFGIPEIDFFIGEAGGPPDGLTLGEYLVSGVKNIGRAVKEYGCPGFLGHPLRWPINTIVGRTGPGPGMPNHEPFPPLHSYDDPRGHVEKLLGIDIGALSSEMVRQDVPVEINEGDWGRILAMNHKTFGERYLFFYHALIDEGTKVILSSDMHNVERGQPTAFVVAEMLGVRPRDMDFLRHWVGEVPT